MRADEPAFTQPVMYEHIKITRQLKRFMPSELARRRQSKEETDKAIKKK